MFRAAATGPYDDTVAKATDENLTNEDWAVIIDICDRVQNDSNGPKDVIQSLIRRLAHRNANVQLYTLELANALAQNGGKPMHRELASRSFTDATLKLANDRNTHSQVKSKIVERMKDWSDMFKNDADLGIMREAYIRLKQANPNLQPPSAPQKNSLTDTDRQKEEDELQMALRLSLQEEEGKAAPPGVRTNASSGGGAGSSSAAAAAGSSRSAPSAGHVAAAAAAATAVGGTAASNTATTTAAAPENADAGPVPAGTTAATVSRVRALFDFVPSEPGELEFKKGDVIAVLESVFKDWWRGSIKGKTGIFPLNYVEKLADPTPEELAREAQMEAEVFAEIKNVEKLLTLLSTNNSAPKEEDSEEISKLYHQTLAIRPKLIKLIEKYSQKKDDFTQLNEKFIKARRDYEALLESSMSHPPQPTYHQYAAPRPPQMGLGGYPQPGPNYPSQPPPAQQQQVPQRFYTPAGQNPASPPPNTFQRVGTAPAPFYMGGVEVPPQGQTPAPQKYPPRQDGPLHPAPLNTNTAGKPPAPVQSSPPPPAGSYTAYQPPQQGGPPQQGQPPQRQQQQQQQQPPAPQGQNRPLSYGNNNPQELATSAYDSPVAAPNNPPSGMPYSAGVHSPQGGEDPYSTAGGALGQQPPQGQQHYTSYQPPPGQGPSSPRTGTGFEAGQGQGGGDGQGRRPSGPGGYKPYIPEGVAAAGGSTVGDAGAADYYRGYGQ